MDSSGTQQLQNQANTMIGQTNGQRQLPPSLKLNKQEQQSKNPTYLNGGGIPMNQLDKQTINNKNLQKLLSAYQQQQQVNSQKFVASASRERDQQTKIQLKTPTANLDSQDAHQNSEGKQQLMGRVMINSKSAQKSKQHTNIGSTASTSGLATTFNATAQAQGEQSSDGKVINALVVSDFQTSYQNSNIKLPPKIQKQSKSQERVPNQPISNYNSNTNVSKFVDDSNKGEDRFSSNLNPNPNMFKSSTVNQSSLDNSPIALKGLKKQSSNDEETKNQFGKDYTEDQYQTGGFNNFDGASISSYEKTANFSSNPEIQQIRTRNKDGSQNQTSQAYSYDLSPAFIQNQNQLFTSISNEVIIQYPIGPMPASQIMSRRPKMNDNTKLIEKVMRRQNQTQQDSRANAITNNSYLSQGQSLAPQNPVGLIQSALGGNIKIQRGKGINQNASSSLIPLVNESGQSLVSIDRMANKSLQQKQQIGLKTPLLNQSKRIADYDSLGETATQDHYMNDRLEKNIQKYSNKDAIKNNIPMLNANGGVVVIGGTIKSRNFNQSSSASKIYNNTLKGIQNNPKLSQSPYVSNNSALGNVNNKLILKSRDIQQNCNSGQVSSSNALIGGMNGDNFSAQLVLNKSSDKNLAYNLRKNETSDLSFESLNPINNSFTEGTQQIDFVNISGSAHQGKKTGLTSKSNRGIGKVQLKSQIAKGSINQLQNDGGIPNFEEQPSNLNYVFNSNCQSDFMSNFNMDEVGLSQAAGPQPFFSSNPHVQWWSQQMQQQQLQQNSQINRDSIQSQNAPNFDVSENVSNFSGNSSFVNRNQGHNLIYQKPDQNGFEQALMGNQIYGGYSQSANVSPFQQSKSRDGGYRNVPIRDLSSISDQSPAKPFDLYDQQNPFKGPKLHLFKKGNSRRIKTSSAARNLQPIAPLDHKKVAQNFNSIHTGGIQTVQNNTSNNSNNGEMININNLIGNHSSSNNGVRNGNGFNSQLLNQQDSGGYYQFNHNQPRNQTANTVANARNNNSFNEFTNPFPLTEQENQYQTIGAKQNTQAQYSSIQHQQSKQRLAPVKGTELSDTIDVYKAQIQNHQAANNQLSTSMCDSISKQAQTNAIIRPNTTHPDGADHSRGQGNSARGKGNSSKISDKTLSKLDGAEEKENKRLSKVELQEEINGFKHSFYNEKGTPKMEIASQGERRASEKDSRNQIQRLPTNDSQNTQSDQPPIKHIFVLNVNLNAQVNSINNLGGQLQGHRHMSSTSRQAGAEMNNYLGMESNGNTATNFNIGVNSTTHKSHHQHNLSNMQSTQESKAMTPCFIHTPNMTNKWGNFKPGAEVKDSANNTLYKQSLQQNPQSQLENINEEDHKDDFNIIPSTQQSSTPSQQRSNSKKSKFYSESKQEFSSQNSNQKAITTTDNANQVIDQDSQDNFNSYSEAMNEVSSDNKDENKIVDKQVSENTSLRNKKPQTSNQIKIKALTSKQKLILQYQQPAKAKSEEESKTQYSDLSNLSQKNYALPQQRVEGDSRMSNQSSHNNSVFDNIKLTPEDIYLINGNNSSGRHQILKSSQQSRNNTMNKANVSQQNLVYQSEQNASKDKPSTSNSFRRPLSRNHPILKINSQHHSQNPSNQSTQNSNIIISQASISSIYQSNMGVNLNSRNSNKQQSQSYVQDRYGSRSDSEDAFSGFEGVQNIKIKTNDKKQLLPVKQTRLTNHIKEQFSTFKNVSSAENVVSTVNESSTQASNTTVITTGLGSGASHVLIPKSSTSPSTLGRLTQIQTKGAISKVQSASKDGLKIEDHQQFSQ